MIELMDSVKHFASIKPNDIAIISDDEILSWAELKHRVSSLTAELTPYSGKVIGLYADNSPDWIAIDLACQCANITLLPLPTFFSNQQLNHAIKQSGADNIILPSAEDITGKRFSIAIESKHKLLSSTHSSLMICEITSHEDVKLPRQTQKITFTSGSTGEPKGVCLSLASQINTSQALISATNLAVVRHIAILPFSTLLENIAGIYAPLLNGGQIITLSQKLLGFNGSQGFVLESLLNAITVYQPSSFILLPELLSAVLVAIDQGWTVPKSIEFIAVGGSKVSQNLLHRAKELSLPIYQGYGLSECTSVVSLNTPENTHIERTGRVLEHLSLEIEDGEVVVSGNAFLGYIDHEDTWYQDKVYTGDLGFIDTQGYLQITGRKKNVLVSSFGRNISPEWLESELLSNGLLSQAVVLGDAAPFCIALVTSRYSETENEDIEQWICQLNQDLPDYAQIKAWQKLPSPMTVEAGLITMNGRPVRHNINQTYQDMIEQLYEGEKHAVL